MSIEGPSAQNLLQRSHKLLAELKSLQNCLDGRKENGAKDIRNFMNQVQSEQKSLQKIASSVTETQSIQHGLKSSNLPFLEAVWSRAKCEHGLVALNKKVHSAREGDKTSEEIHEDKQDESIAHQRRQKPQSLRSSIDIVSENGLRWIKVSLITEKRLLFELAENGWTVEDDTSDEEMKSNGDNSSNSDAKADTLLSIQRTASILLTEARKTRVRYRHPDVILVLPNMHLGNVPEVDRVIGQIRASGVTLHTAADLPPVHAFEDVLGNLISEKSREFASVINIDCTILLSLVSDISHSNDAVTSWQSPIIKKQIEAEIRENLLPTVLYPLMKDRKIVCTREAAKHMQELVDTIGTQSEKQRTAVFLGRQDNASRKQLSDNLSKLSCYPVPQDLRLPIEVVAEQPSYPNLPPVATIIVQALKHPINRSVFLYGWATACTTITSNAVVTKQIERLVEENRSSVDEIGPDIWLCAVPRSLIGKQPRQRSRGAQR